MTFPAAAIREFSVHTTQMPAQYGQGAGGVVNIVTKSGTNTLHGEAFEFFRNQQMNRNDIFTQQQVDAGRADPRYKRQPVRLRRSAGRSSRTSCTTSAPFERTREHSVLHRRTRRRSSIRRWRAAFEGGSFTNIAFVRGDYQMNSKQNLFYRYVNQHTEFFCSGCGGTQRGVQPARQPDSARHARRRSHVGAVEPRAERVLLHAGDRLGSQLP